MAKFRWTKDAGVNWTVVEASLPYNIAGVVASDTVIVEPIGDAVTELPLETSTYAVTSATSLSLKLTTDTGNAVMVDWGDGSAPVECASGATVSRSGTSYSGNVTVTAKDATTKLTRWDSSSNGWSFNLSSLPSGLTYFNCGGSNTIAGNLSSLPSGMTSFGCYGSNTIAGDISSLPSGMTTFTCSGSNTIAGNLSSLPSGLTSFTCTGSNTVTGNLSSLPSGLTYFNCSGSNTVTGNLSSLPSGLTTFTCYGSNTVTGNLSSLPSGLTSFTCTGSNTVTGNLSSLPSGLTYFYCTGSNTVTGNLSSLPSGLTYFYCTAFNTVTYSGGTWYRSSMRNIYCRGAAALSSAVCDALLIELAATVVTWTNEKTINIRGSRTSASDAAVTTLQAIPVSVTVN